MTRPRLALLHGADPADLTRADLRILIGDALQALRDGDWITLASLARSLRATALPLGAEPCPWHGGRSCSICGGEGYLTPTDAIGMAQRGALIMEAALRVLPTDDRDGRKRLFLLAGHAYADAAYQPHPHRERWISFAVRCFLEAGETGEARHLLRELSAFASDAALRTAGMADVVTQRAARREMERSRAGLHLIELDEVKRG